MVQYNNNRRGLEQSGSCLDKLKIVVFLAEQVSLYVYVNSDVTDTFTYELWFC